MLAVFSSQYHTTTVGSFGCSGTCCLSMCPLKSTLIYCALSSSQVVGCEVAPGWWNTPAFVQVLLESRGSLNQNFYRIENHELNVMIAAGLADWKSELLFSGKHWCFQKKTTKNQPKTQKQTPKQNPTKKNKNKHLSKTQPKKQKQTTPNKKLSVFSLEKVGLFFPLKIIVL